MSEIIEAVRSVLRTEWRHTFLSARREYTLHAAARMFLGQLAARLLDVPAYAAELRRR